MLWIRSVSPNSVPPRLPSRQQLVRIDVADAAAAPCQPRRPITMLRRPSLVARTVRRNRWAIAGLIGLFRVSLRSGGTSRLLVRTSRPAAAVSVLLHRAATAASGGRASYTVHPRFAMRLCPSRHASHPRLSLLRRTQHFRRDVAAAASPAAKRRCCAALASSPA